MKVINNTTWKTADLRAILQAAAERELEPAKRRRLVVIVDYTRGGYSSGCAHIGGRYATVRIQKVDSQSWDNSRFVNGVRVGPMGLTDVRRREIVLHFASVASHEFAHIRGMDHDRMPANYKWHGRWREYVAWAENMPLAVQERKVKTVTPDDKLAHVLTKVRQAETRLKRAETILKKWKQKKRYYERKMAAQKSEGQP